MPATSSLQNGDPEKEVIAQAQTYFAVQTRRQELADAGALDDPERAYLDWYERAVKSYMARGYSESWARSRVDGITIHNRLTHEWSVRGITGKEYAILTEAADERRRIASRLLGGRRQRSKLDGRGSGPLPYGYTHDERGAISIDERAAEAIRLALGMRDAGISAEKTAQAMNERGYVTASGQEWTRKVVRQVEGHRELYETGKREWGDVVSEGQWPILYSR